MPMPAHFQAYWDAHPEKRPGQNSGPRRKRNFPRQGTPQEQAVWFRDQFLTLAEKEKNPTKKAVLLAKAMSATVQTSKASPEKPADPNKEYREHLERMIANRENDGESKQPTSN